MSKLNNLINAFSNYGLRLYRISEYTYKCNGAILTIIEVRQMLARLQNRAKYEVYNQLRSV